MFGPFRYLTYLGLLGAAVGIFFGAKGALTAKDAVDSVNAKGGDAKSMFRAENLSKGIDKVRAKVGDDGKLLQLNIYPGYIAVDASTGSEDKGRSFRVQMNGKVDELPVTLTGPGKVEDNVFPLDQLDAATVQKLAEQTAAKEHTDLDGLTHIIATIDPIDGKPAINVYAANSRYWSAGLDGKGLSNPVQNASKTMDDVEKTVAGLDSETPAPKAVPSSASAKPANAQDLGACVQAAGTDAAKISACTG
jgi:hypothetical protein